MRLGSSSLALWISAASTTACARSFGVTSRRNSRPAAFLRASPRSRKEQFLLRMASTDSSKSLRVALCQFQVTSSKTENYKTAKDFLSQASDKGVELAVLPEIWNSPYATAAFPEYAENLPSIGDTCADGSPSAQLLIEAAKELNMWIVGGSIPERVTEGGDEQIYNTCLVLNPKGEVVAKHRKAHLFDIDVPGGITFFESDTLSPGNTVSHFEMPAGKIGLGICYDIRFQEYAAYLRKKYGCIALIYPGAFNMTTGPAHWELLQRARAVDNQCYVMMASPARTPPPEDTPKYPHYTAWGHSTIVSPWGDVVATIDEKAGLVIADLDFSKVDEVRKAIPIGDQTRPEMYE